MSFTDDDLKRLQIELKRVASSPSSLPLDEMVVAVGYSECAALIARMEAAEVAAVAVAYIPTHGWGQFYEKQEAWRKAAGK